MAYFTKKKDLQIFINTVKLIKILTQNVRLAYVPLMYVRLMYLRLMYLRLMYIRPMYV